MKMGGDSYCMQRIFTHARACVHVLLLSPSNNSKEAKPELYWEFRLWRIADIFKVEEILQADIKSAGPPV